MWAVQRHRALDPYRLVLVVLLYLRHNLSQQLLAALFGCSQPTISGGSSRPGRRGCRSPCEPCRV
jgi:hypothetical protein